MNDTNSSGNPFGTTTHQIRGQARNSTTRSFQSTETMAKNFNKLQKMQNSL